MVFLSLLWVAEPLFGRYAVDEIIKLAEGESVNIPRIFALWIGIYIAISLTQGIRFYYYWKFQNTLLIDVREYYYRKLLLLDVSHHIKARGGEMMKKLDNAADAAVDLARTLLLEIPSAVFTSVIFYGLSFYVSWKLALIAVCMIPVYLVVISLTVRKTRQDIDKVNNLWVRSIGRGYDAIANIFTVKSSGSEDRELQTMYKKHRDGIQFLNRVNVSWALLEGIGYFMLMRIILIGVGLLLFARGEISLGSVFFFQFGFFRMIVPMEMLAHNMPLWNEKIGKIRLAEEKLLEQVMVTNENNAQTLDDMRGEIAFQDVTFSYGDADALTDVSFSVAPGEHIAFVGHSGAGKSTAAMLLNRFYDVSSGAIVVDGVDLRQLDMYWWRKQVGLVLQENIMFNDSVIDNIRYSRPDATDAEVHDAAERASAHAFIEKLPEGYNTLIGERGIRLSGGERQRVAIARAILKQPKIVVLDEATSALDSKTEKAVQEGIAELMKGRTSFIIAHRLSTVRTVDRIAVLDKGKLLCIAPHEQLLESCDVYREMVELQSHGMLAE